MFVEDPRCQEIVIEGEALNRPGNGVDALPIPISTPGFDNAPYASCSMFITKDPDTGLQNIGNYRAMVKSPTRMEMNPESNSTRSSTSTFSNTRRAASGCRWR